MGHFARDCKRIDTAVLRLAPREGEPEKKLFEHGDGTSTERFWCGKCGLWNRTHITANHQSKADLAASNAKPGPSVSFAKITPPASSDNDNDHAKIIAAAHRAHAMKAGCLEPSSN
jgi:hypothetical protein